MNEITISTKDAKIFGLTEAVIIAILRKHNHGWTYVNLRNFCSFIDPMEFSEAMLHLVSEDILVFTKGWAFSEGEPKEGYSISLDMDRLVRYEG